MTAPSAPGVDRPAWLGRPAPGAEPAVSVVMPLRDAARFVPSALEQVLAQTFTDWELLVVLDGPDPETEELLDGLSGAGGLRVLARPEPSGVAACRNAAVQQARGRYVWFTDADDAWSPHLLERLHAAAVAGGCDVVLCRSEKQLPDGSREPMPLPEAPAGVLAGEEYVRALVAGTVNGHLWNKLFTRAVLGRDPFPLQRTRSDLGGVLGVTDRVRRAGVVDEVLYTWQVREGSMSNSGVITPMDLLACGERFAQVAARLPAGQVREADRLRYLYNKIYRPALARTWRYGDRAVDGDEVQRRVRAAVTARDLGVLWRDGARGLALAAGAYRTAPRLTAAAARRLRRGKWARWDVA